MYNIFHEGRRKDDHVEPERKTHCSDEMNLTNCVC